MVFFLYNLISNRIQHRYLTKTDSDLNLKIGYKEVEVYQVGDILRGVLRREGGQIIRKLCVISKSLFPFEKC